MQPCTCFQERCLSNQEALADAGKAQQEAKPPAEVKAADKPADAQFEEEKSGEAKPEGKAVAKPKPSDKPADKPLVLNTDNSAMQSSFILGYKQFWPFLKPYAWVGILGILLTIPVGALDAMIASFLKPFMDRVMIDQNQTFADYVPFIIVGFTIVQGCFIYLSSVVNGWVGGKINLNMRSALFNKLLHCDTRFFDTNYSGSVIFRFCNDANLASNGLISNIRLFLTKFFSSVALIYVLFYNSWELSLLALVELVVLVIPLRIVKNKIKKIVGKTMAGNANIISLYNESTMGSKVIKVYGLKERMFGIFDNQANFLFKMGMKMVRETNWLSPVMHIVSSLGIAAVLYFGMHLILTEQITPGAFVAFLAALIMLYTPLKSIGNNFIQVQQALLAIHRISELLNMTSYEDQSQDKGKLKLEDIKDEIEFKDLHFSYNADKEILRGINLKIKAGQKVALVGNSGGGKSTVCSLIPRLYEINKGHILIDGHDIREYTLDSLRSQIAMVFQDSFLFDGTIKENVLCGKPTASEDEIAEALKNSYLDDFIKTLPNGVNTLIGERGILLSGGQKQRVSIARAMIRKSPLVILDEATSALDNKAEKIVQKALDNLMKGRTTIVIAHRLSTIQDADIILVINDGQIVEQGTHEELLKLGGAYNALYKAQFKAPEEVA